MQSNSEEAEQLTPLEAAEKRRATKKRELEKKREAREVLDLEAIEKIEEEIGEVLGTLRLNRFAEGLPVRIAYRPPTEAEYKRFSSMVKKAGKNEDARSHAQELICNACWVYPADIGERKALLASSPGILNSLAVEIAKLVEARSEEGKGD